jgi:hypothetical protein
MEPGQTAWMRMPRAAYSRAAVLVRPTAYGDRGRPGGRQPVGGGVHRFLILVGEDHGGARLGKGAGGREAYA